MSRGDHEWVQCDPRSWKTCDEGRMELRVRWIHGWVIDGSCMSWMGNGRVVGGSIDGPWVGQTRVRGGGQGAFDEMTRRKSVKYRGGAGHGRDKGVSVVCQRWGLGGKQNGKRLELGGQGMGEEWPRGK